MQKFWNAITPTITALSGPITAIVERVILAGCIWIVAHSDGFLTSADATTIAAALYTIVSVVFGALKNTQASKIAQVAADPDVQKIVIKKDANGAAAANAADPNQPKIEQAK